MLVYPFKGLLYNKDKIGGISEVLTPPYDVISKEAQEGFRKYDYNVIDIILNKPMPDDNDTNNPHTRARDILEKWIGEKVLVQDAEPAFYIYAQKFSYRGQDRERLGFVGLGRIDDSPQNTVLPHEKTFTGPKLDREKLLETTAANTSSIFCLFQDAKQTVDAVLREHTETNEPLFEAEVDGVINRLWRVSDEASIKKIQDIMRDESVFIADGHHRYGAAKNYRDRMIAQNPEAGTEAPHNFVMMYFVSMQDKGVTIYSTHRIFKSFNGLSQGDFANALSQSFEISDPMPEKECFEKMEDHGQNGHVFGMYAGDGFRILNLRTSLDSRFRGNDSPPKLDTAILQKLVVEDILKIGPQDIAEFITYTRETDVAVKLVDEKTCACAFFLNPTRLEQVRDMSLARKKMPQKSTYFYPKLLTGLVMRKL